MQQDKARLCMWDDAALNSYTAALPTFADTGVCPQRTLQLLEPLAANADRGALGLREKSEMTALQKGQCGALLMPI